MGASAWSYRVPHQPDIGAALKALRQEVRSRGWYYRPRIPTVEAYRREALASTNLSEDEIATAYRETFRDGYGAEDGTHSILDIERIAGEPAFGVAAPFPEADLLEVFGTTTPTMEQVDRAVRTLCGGAPTVFGAPELPCDPEPISYESAQRLQRRRWQGSYIVSYRITGEVDDSDPDDLQIIEALAPRWIHFFGYSGD